MRVMAEFRPLPAQINLYFKHASHPILRTDAASLRGRGTRLAARPCPVGCAHINIRASRARMMTINRGINGVSDKDMMRDVEGSHPTHRASRLRRGPVPRRRAFGSGETVARFGVRETIELVRRFFNISGLCHNPILDSPSRRSRRPRAARGRARAAGYLASLRLR